MWLTLGDRAVHDGELSLDEVVSRTEAGDFTTSGPTPGEFATAIEAAGVGVGVVVVTLAREMSSTYESARLAAGLFDDGRVRVVDSRTAAGAEGLVALAAARCAASGGTLDEVEAAARRVAAQVHLVAALESVARVARGGRVPAAAARAGRALGVQPRFEFRDGRARPLVPALSRGGARQRLVAAWAKAPAGNRLHLAVMHALDRPGADALLAELRARVEPATTFVGSFSPVMVAHTGPGLLGLAWWWETAAHGSGAGG
jgi:DegV family protein with EDD domain